MSNSYKNLPKVKLRVCRDFEKADFIWFSAY